MAAVVGRLSGPDRLVVLAFALCFVVVLLLQLRASAVVWETVPLISFVQFPQRLFVFGSFAGAIVLGSVPWAVGVLAGRPRLAVVAGVAVVGCCSALTSLPGIYWTWPVAGSHIIDEEQVGIGTAAERRLSERRAFDDYFPTWVEEDVEPDHPAGDGQSGGGVPRRERRAGAAPRASGAGVPAPRAPRRGRGAVDAGPAPVLLPRLAGRRRRHAARRSGRPGRSGWSRSRSRPVSTSCGSGSARRRSGWRRSASALVALVLLLAVLVAGLGAAPPGCSGWWCCCSSSVGPRLLHDRLDPDERPAVRSRPGRSDAGRAGRRAGACRRPARPGQIVPVTLLWQAARLHAARPSDRPAAGRPGRRARASRERWGRPNRERTPTGKWLVGELVPDTLLLRIPNDAPPAGTGCWRGCATRTPTTAPRSASPRSASSRSADEARAQATELVVRTGVAEAVDDVVVDHARSPACART